jgi:hypothetical protein
MFPKIVPLSAVALNLGLFGHNFFFGWRERGRNPTIFNLLFQILHMMEG